MEKDTGKKKAEGAPDAAKKATAAMVKQQQTTTTTSTKKRQLPEASEGHTNTTKPTKRAAMKKASSGTTVTLPVTDTKRAAVITTADVGRPRMTSRVKTVSMEEVSKFTDVDDAFDGLPEVEMPQRTHVPKSLVTTAPKSSAPMKKQTTTTRDAPVVPKPRAAPAVVAATPAPAPGTRATKAPAVLPKASGPLTAVDTKNYLDIYQEHKTLQGKYMEMKSTKLSDAEINTESFNKNVKEHAQAHLELAENWKSEALRLAEVNRQAGSEETLEKLKSLAAENAELRRKIAQAELRDIELTRSEENMKRALEDAKASAMQSEERASKAEEQSHDVLTSAEHRIHATNLRFAEYKKKAEAALESGSKSEDGLKNDISDLKTKVSKFEEASKREGRLFQMLTGMQRRDYTSGASTVHQFVHPKSGFSFRISVPDIHNECEVSYEPIKMGRASGRLPEYFEDEVLSFSSSQLSAFFAKMLNPLQKCPPK